MYRKTHLLSRRLIPVVIAASLIFFCFRLYYRLTDDFRIGNMTHEMAYNPDWDSEPLSGFEMEGLRTILDQSFYYLGKGAQSYAFVSADHQYVLKFFKFKHLKPNWLIQSLPDFPFCKEYKEKKRNRKQRLINSVFNGYKLAYDNLREESALLYIHLNTSLDLLKPTTFFDKIGRKHTIDLDRVVFVLQKYAATTRQALTSALEAGDLALATLRLDKIIDLYRVEYGKGIYDRDHGLMHNTGFFGERAVHLDVGKLSCDAKMKNQEWVLADLALLQKRFESWVKRHFTDYHAFMMEHWNQKMGQVLEETNEEGSG